LSDLLLEIVNANTNLPYVLWQFSANARLSNGYAGLLDADIFKGTDAQFRDIFLTKN
jgi:hypothetical protein